MSICCSRVGSRKQLYLSHVYSALSLPAIVSCPHPKPDIRTMAKSRTEADRDFGRDRPALGQNIVEMLAGNIDGVSGNEPANIIEKFGDRLVQCWIWDFPEQAATRMADSINPP